MYQQGRNVMISPSRPNAVSQHLLASPTGEYNSVPGARSFLGRLACAPGTSILTANYITLKANRRPVFMAYVVKTIKNGGLIKNKTHRAKPVNRLTETATEAMARISRECALAAGKARQRVSHTQKHPVELVITVKIEQVFPGEKLRSLPGRKFLVQGY